MTTTTRVLTLLWIAALAGCGGAQSSEPAAEAPSSEKPAESDEPAAKEEGSEAKDEAKADSKEESGKAEEASKKDEKPAKSPKDILTTEGVLFSFSFADSAVGEAAEKDCSEKAGDDAKKKADCMAKARDKVDHDGLIFKKEADGNWTWTTLRRSGSKLTVLHKVGFEFGEEKDNTITIKPKGKDKGTKPKAFPASITIETRDEQITLDDPKLGKMVYVSKFGAVGDAGR
jgi:hypothetical protein